MLWYSVSVFQLSGYACNLCETPPVIAEEDALAPMRHLLSQ